MRVILSPAKTMVSIPDSSESYGLPCFLTKAEQIYQWMQSKSEQELQTVWACSKKIAEQNMKRLSQTDLRHNLTPAIRAYDGAVFRHINPSTLSEKSLSYLQDHLRILSAFYGVLKPMDGIVPYRLEMQSMADISGQNSMYQYWGNLLYNAVRDPDGIILNLASQEYSKAIEPYLTKQDCFITISFCDEYKGKLKTKGTYAKMARGEMVRFMAENLIETPEHVKDFKGLDYQYQKELSSESEYVFIR